METAKVDIRKLQLLNDRINQCIDALAQVRLSVHGLSHSNPMGNIGNNPWQQQQSQGSPFGQGLGVQGFGAGVPGYGFGQGSPGIFGQQQSVNPFTSQVGGLSHSSPDVLQYSSQWGDPSITSRLYQTFPYAQMQIPPVVSLY